jgi:tetratricopeptide (TPR) repeat protein
MREALDAFQRALHLKPDEPNALFNSGILHMRRAEYARAGEALERFCKAHPGDSLALAAYATTLKYLGRTTQAREASVRAAAAAGTAEMALQAAQVLLDANFSSEAGVILRSAVGKWPGCDECVVVLARAEFQSLRELGRDYEAIDVLERALNRFPREKSAYADLVTAYADLGQAGAAERVMRTAAERWPDDKALQNALVNASRSESASATVQRLAGTPAAQLSAAERGKLLQAFLSLEKYEQAERFANVILSLGSAPESAVIALANLLQVAQRDTEALDLLNQQRSRFSNSSAYLFTLALSEFNVGRYAASFDFAQAALQRRPDMDQAHFLAGHSLASRGSLKEALECYQKALELAPAKARYQFQVGMLLQQLGRNAEAISHLERAIALDGAFSASRYELAKAYFHGDRMELAMDQLRATVKMDPDHEGAHFLLARIYTRLGQANEAAAAMVRLKEIQSGNHEARRNARQTALAAGMVTP